MALWPLGPNMIDEAIRNVITREFPEMVYGVGLCEPRLQPEATKGHRGRSHRPEEAVLDGRAREEHQQSDDEDIRNLTRASI